MQKLIFFQDVLAERYGHALHRIPVDLGFSCPNRHPNGKGGCAFCDESGSRARHLAEGMSLEEQVRKGIAYVTERYHAESPYAAYFQAFTSTNAAVTVLREQYERVLSLADFKVVIIGTRPDCLPDECVNYLRELAGRYEVWVELGVQTASNETLRRINRGHDFACAADAARKLHDAGIHVAAHVILGLPGESRKDYLNTAHALAALPVEAVKVHNLLVLKGTAMARMFDQGMVSPLNEYEYAAELAAFLRELPDRIMLMRVSSEAPEDRILAPHWWMKKGQFLSMFQRYFDSGLQTTPEEFFACRTNDGSYTLYHPLYKQHFHSVAGAWEESFRKYLDPCRVREKLTAGENISILDVGFGMGYNVSAAASLAEEIGRGKVYLVSLEADRNVLDAALTLPEHQGRKYLTALQQDGRYESEYASIDVMWGDARSSVVYMKSHFDDIFLDGFSPDTNPELWTLEFIRELKELLKDDGFLASYSSAFPFLGALMQNGFRIYESRAFGRRRGGTVASLDANPWLPPLAEKDVMVAKHSTAGTPYRDPGLRLTREEMLSNRKAEIKQLRASGVPKWYNARKAMCKPDEEPEN